MVIRIKKKLFGAQKVDFGVFNGADFGLVGLEMRFERNKKVGFLKLNLNLEAQIQNSMSKTQNYGFRTSNFDFGSQFCLSFSLFQNSNLI